MSSRALFWWAVAAAFVVGAVTAVHYAGLDLTLSHYDAKGHLVVARRIADSLRPGWWQIGAVWLPLPHLLNAGPVQVDAWYRTGFSGVAMSVGCFALAVGTLVWLIHRATGSIAGAAAGAVVLASQPDVLYLQSTPMTEPLLMALTLGGVALTWRWAADGAEDPPTAAGVLLGLACLTRYEAWPITAAAIGAAAVALVTSGKPVAVTVRRVALLAAYPVAAIVAFLCLSRATVGAWFVTGGFFVADNPDYHRPFKAAGSVWWAMRKLNGNATVGLAVAGLVVLAWAMLRDRAHRALLVTLALAGCAALPIFAFYQGHPFRIRYMVVLAMMLAVVERPRRRPAAAAADSRGDPRGGRGPHPHARCVGIQPPAAVVVDGVDGARSAMGSPAQHRSPRGPRLPRARTPRRADPGEHGIARPSDAGDVGGRDQPARLHPRRHRSDLGRQPRASGASRRLGADRRTIGRRRRAGGAAARAPGFPRQLRSDL